MLQPNGNEQKQPASEQTKQKVRLGRTAASRQCGAKSTRHWKLDATHCRVKWQSYERNQSGSQLTTR